MSVTLRLVPIRRFRIEADQAPADVLEALRHDSESVSGPLPSFRTDRSFIGEVRGNRFEFRIAERRANSARAILVGAVHSGARGLAVISGTACVASVPLLFGVAALAIAAWLGGPGGKVFSLIALPLLVLVYYGGFTASFAEVSSSPSRLRWKARAGGLEAPKSMNTAVSEPPDSRGRRCPPPPNPSLARGGRFLAAHRVLPRRAPAVEAKRKIGQARVTRISVDARIVR